MNKYKYLTKKENHALEALIRNLKDELKGSLINVKLFGSKSRGDYTPDSDIDVLLVVKSRSPEILDKIAEIHLEVDLMYDSQISLIIFSEYEYERNQAFESPFIKNIEKEGIFL